MSFNGFMNDQIVLQSILPNTGRHGEEAHTPQQTLKGRFEQVTTTIRTAEEERTPIDGRVFLPARAAVSRGDRLTYNGQNYKVMRAEPIKVMNGRIHHHELMVQLWSTAS